MTDINKLIQQMWWLFPVYSRFYLRILFYLCIDVYSVLYRDSFEFYNNELDK